MAAVTLYLDFDGVLHPGLVFMHDGKPRLEMFDHLDLFCWAPILEDLLKPFPEVQIRISSSWVGVMGFSYAKQQLTPGLQRRVIGATYDPDFEKFFSGYSRCEQIMIDVCLQNIGEHWLAIDDDDKGWPADQHHRLVLANQYRGISDESVQQQLVDRLQELRSARAQAC